MSECHFHIEIHAPEGLVGIEQYIQNCRLNLMPWKSGYNGKVILRQTSDKDIFEWSMDSSDTDILVAEGAFFLNAEQGEELLNSLSYILAIAGFPHKWGLDDEKGNPKSSGQFKWGDKIK